LHSVLAAADRIDQPVHAAAAAGFEPPQLPQSVPYTLQRPGRVATTPDPESGSGEMTGREVHADRHGIRAGRSVSVDHFQSAEMAAFVGVVVAVVAVAGGTD